MPKSTPQEAAQEWATKLGGATAKIQRGVERLTVSPTEQAAKAQTKMLQNLTAAVTSGKWAARLRAVPLQQWQSDMINKGLTRIGSGASQAQPKMSDFFTQLFPYQDSLQQKVSGMNNVTKEDAKARMNAWFDGMVAFKRK